MVAALGSRGAVNAPNTDNGFALPIPRGLQAYQTQQAASRTDVIVTAKQDAHAIGHSPLNSCFFELSSIDYQQKKTKPLPPFPKKLDGFIKFGHGFQMSALLLDVLYTLATKWGNWQKRWEEICGIPWNVL